jgi:hypothetical protein
MSIYDKNYFENYIALLNNVFPKKINKSETKDYGKLRKRAYREKIKFQNEEKLKEKLKLSETNNKSLYYVSELLIDRKRP